MTRETLGEEDFSAAKRALLEKRRRGGVSPVRDQVGPRPVGSRTPASAEQYRIWLHAAMEPNLPIYNESFTIHRLGTFDPQAFEAAFNEVIRRHEVLRTSFCMIDGELMQEIAPELRVAFPFVDISSFHPDQREAEALRLASENATAPIAISSVPLFRARLICIAPAEHWLQLTIHHIICDGSSVHRILLPELAAIYAAFTEGEQSPLLKPALQYADYALWRERNLRSEANAQHLDFWARELRGELPVLRMPTDRARPSIATHQGAVAYFTFPAELLKAIRLLAKEHKLSVYTVLLGSLKILLFRYSGQEDVIVGSIADGRRQAELAQVMGYFLDTFAVRTKPSARLTGIEYLEHVRDTLFAALDAARVPFSQVVQVIQQERSSSRDSIFEVFFSYQPEAGSVSQEWLVSKTRIDTGATKFDIYIEVDERPEAALAQLTYNTELFDAATIQRMIAHWHTLLADLVNNPATTLGKLALLTPEERQQMLVEWNETGVPLPQGTVSEWVARAALQRPTSIAIEFEDRLCTYAELDDRTQRLARHLQQAGAKRSATIALFLDRSENLPIALLAVMKTGGCYLPLDPSTPPARIALCLEDAEPAVILTQRSLAGQLPKTGAVVVLLEDVLSQGCDAAPVPNSARLEDAAYVIHTSGSTGRPKAVEISHQALANLLSSMLRQPGIHKDDTMLAVTTVAFDIAQLELLLPLIAGGRLVIASRDTAMDPYRLAAEIKRTHCTIMQATPATWQGLVAMGWSGKQDMRILCGGERLSRELAEHLLPLGSAVWNMYGPTETTIWSAIHHVSHGKGPVVIGRPIANTTTYILDHSQQPVPVGVMGTLFIGGAGLATGYRGQPELTRARFIHPGLRDNERLYCTGDYASYQSDGTIQVHGRSDNQVKVRGYRFELEDLEASLMEHPGIAACVAKLWREAAGESVLCAYLVGRAQPAPDLAELRRFLLQRLPDYMIPTAVVELKTFPLTSNGKVDRKALTRPGGNSDLNAGPPEVNHPAGTEEERELAALWAKVLHVNPVSLNDNFFDLGGHSLLVARLQHEIFVRFKRKVSMAALFHAPTLARQVSLLQEAQGVGDPARVIPIQPLGSVAPLFWVEPSPLIQNLANALGREQPFFGVTMTTGDLQLLGQQPTLEEIARLYAENIQKVQPHGPYHVGGFCTGGILAYAIAHHLQITGNAVASVILLDAENPAFYERLGSLAMEFSKLRFYAMRALRSRSVEEFTARVKFRARRLLRIPPPAQTEMLVISNAIAAAAFLYNPPDYENKVLLFLSEDRPSARDYLSGWKVVVKGQLECVEISGSHGDLLTEACVAGIVEVLLGGSANSSEGTSWLAYRPAMARR